MENIKLLLYCTKQPLYLVRNESDGYFYTMDKGTLNDYKSVETYNGKIVAECDFEVQALERIGDYIRFAGVEDGEWLNNMYYEYKSCLSEEELFNYIKDKFYAIHIKNLNIFDEPKELREYGTETSPIFMKPIAYAPQNMMYAYLGNNKYILISIRPEHLVKILNGEKTVELRKRVLKEMVK